MGALTSRLSELQLRSQFNDTTWLPPLAGVKKLIGRFEEMQLQTTTGYGFRIDLKGFKYIYDCGSKSEEEVTAVFKIWSNGQEVADALTIFAGSILCCKAKFRSKADLLFRTFDMDFNKQLSQAEMTIMLKASIQGLCLMTLDSPVVSIHELEVATRAAFKAADHGGALATGVQDSKIEKREFYDWVSSSRDAFAYIARFNTTESEKASQMKKVRDPNQPTLSEEKKKAKRAGAVPVKPSIRAKFKKDHVLVIKRVFDEIDKDSGGTVSAKELSDAFRHKNLSLFQSGKQKEMTFKEVLQIVFNDATAAELQIMDGWTKYNTIPKPLILRLKDIFDSCDEDCTATVSLRTILDILAPSEKLNKFVKITPLDPGEPDKQVTLHQLLHRMFAGLPKKQKQQILSWAVPSKALTDDQRLELRGLFQLYDGDNSGEISMDELREAFSDLTDEEITHLFTQFEVSPLHQVSFPEFQRIYRRVWEGSKIPA